MKTLQIPPRQSGVTLIELMVRLSHRPAGRRGRHGRTDGFALAFWHRQRRQRHTAKGPTSCGWCVSDCARPGSLYLNPDPVGGNSTDVLSPVAFEIKADAVGSGNSFHSRRTPHRHWYYRDHGVQALPGQRFQWPTTLQAPPSAPTFWPALCGRARQQQHRSAGRKALSPLAALKTNCNAAAMAPLRRRWRKHFQQFQVTYMVPNP